MYFQYPLESLARKRATADQMDFAREAQRALPDSDEVMFEPLARGLAIFAAHEDALVEPRRVLHDLYGDFVEVRDPRVRYMPGEPAHEPVMHVRITARRAPGNAVFEARQRYDDGAVVRWEATLTVVPPPGDEPDQHLGRALVAGAVGLARSLTRPGSKVLAWCWYAERRSLPLVSYTGPSRIAPFVIEPGEEHDLFDGFEIERPDPQPGPRRALFLLTSP